jgi:hypothetical protein
MTVYIAPVRAFFFSGRLKVMVRMPSAWLVWISVMVVSLGAGAGTIAYQARVSP